MLKEEAAQSSCPMPIPTTRPCWLFVTSLSPLETSMYVYVTMGSMSSRCIRSWRRSRRRFLPRFLDRPCRTWPTLRASILWSRHHTSTAHFHATRDGWRIGGAYNMSRLAKIEAPDDGECSVMV